MTHSSKPVGFFSILHRLIRGGLLNAAGIGFALYILVICYSGISASPDMLMSLRTGEISMADVGENNLQIAVPLISISLALFARHGALSILRHQQALLIMLCLFSSIVIFLTAMTGTLPVSVAQIAQNLVTVGIFFLCLCFWQAPKADIANALAMAFIALAGILVAGALLQGFHDYRWVGLIHPNHYARYAYVALVLHSIVMRRVSLPIAILAFSAAYMVSARTIMIGILIFYVGYLLLAARGISADRQRKQACASVLAWCFLMAAPLVVLAFMAIDSDDLLSRLSNDFAVFDVERGVLSGFTGRTSSWNAFFETIPDFVMYGYGFRSSRYELHAVHSGVLSYFMDFGLIFGGGLLAAVIWRTIYLLASGRSSYDPDALICGLALATTLVIQCFEPDNFNIGFIGSFFFILILAYTPRKTPRIHANRHDAASPGDLIAHKASPKAFLK